MLLGQIIMIFYLVERMILLDIVMEKMVRFHNSINISVLIIFGNIDECVLTLLLK